MITHRPYWGEFPLSENNTGALWIVASSRVIFGIRHWKNKITLLVLWARHYFLNILIVTHCISGNYSWWLKYDIKTLSLKEKKKILFCFYCWAVPWKTFFLLTTSNNCNNSNGLHHLRRQLTIHSCVPKVVSAQYSWWRINIFWSHDIYCSVHPGEGSSSVALLKGSSLFPPEGLFGSFSWSDVRSKVKGQGCLCGQIVKHSEANL